MRCLTLPLAFLLAAGCAVDAPPPVAPPYGAMHRASAFQQFCEQAWNVPHASALVAARGADGWELVAMYNGALCYKRPVFDAAREARPQLGPSAPAGPPGAFVPMVRDPGF
jgi:hypothetical protein